MPSIFGSHPLLAGVSPLFFNNGNTVGLFGSNPDARIIAVQAGTGAAGLIGSLGAIALTWGVSRYALEIPWRVFAGEHVAGVLLTALLVAIIGVVSSLDVLKNKPLATLRAE